MLIYITYILSIRSNGHFHGEIEQFGNVSCISQKPPSRLEL